MNHCVERLRASGVRVTSGRIFVLQAIEQAEIKKLRVEDIFRELVRNGTPLSLGSVYRVLKELTRDGLLTRVWDRGGDDQKYSCWMQSDAGEPAAPELVCRDCGHTVPLADSRLEAQIRRAAERAGLAAGDATLSIQIVCADCVADRET